jgi:hypothetical protein
MYSSSHRPKTDYILHLSQIVTAVPADIKYTPNTKSKRVHIILSMLFYFIFLDKTI